MSLDMYKKVLAAFDAARSMGLQYILRKGNFGGRSLYFLRGCDRIVVSDPGRDLFVVRDTGEVEFTIIRHHFKEAEMFAGFGFAVDPHAPARILATNGLFPFRGRVRLDAQGQCVSEYKFMQRVANRKKKKAAGAELDRHLAAVRTALQLGARDADVNHMLNALPVGLEREAWRSVSRHYAAPPHLDVARAKASILKSTDIYDYKEFTGHITANTVVVRADFLPTKED